MLPSPVGRHASVGCAVNSSASEVPLSLIVSSLTQMLSCFPSPLQMIFVLCPNAVHACHPGEYFIVPIFSTAQPVRL